MQALSSSLASSSLSSSAAARPRELIVRERGEGEQIWFLDNFLTVKVSANDATPYGMMEAVLPAGSVTPYHRHADEDEAFYVLEGAITFFVEGAGGTVRRVHCGPGAYVHVPTGVAHGFRTESAIRMLVITGVSGFIEMVRQAGERAERPEPPPPAAPDMAKLDAAATRCRIALLGPLPES